ncbi:MAG: bifunctional riboflavin kinase/FAD synthetase [Nocardioidaceae bacterium]
MQVWHDVSEIGAGFGPSVVTIGNFDGVHLGHQHVLSRAHELAAEGFGLPVVAVTFDPHPMSVVAPDRAPQALLPSERRNELLAEAGVDAVLVLTFTHELAQVSAEDFVTAYLFGALNAGAIVVGENFRYGHRAQGDVSLLRRMGDEHNVRVQGLALDGRSGAGGQVWSSTYIRRCLAEGDVAAAAEALGRPFTIRGHVVRGEQRGRELGFPTANVPVATSVTAVPADGVYAGWLRRLDADDVADGAYLPAAISVGTNPTFDGTDRRVESYVLDRTDLELYDVLVEVAFVERLRGMVKFDAVDALIAQMDGDMAQARTILATPAGAPPPVLS